MKNQNEKRRTLIFCTILVIGISILYQKFLFSDVRYIFGPDIGSDSIYQTYPYMLDVSERIWNGGAGGYWNNYEGLGNAERSVSFGLMTWMGIFGSEAIDYLLGIRQILLVFFSGLFAYKYAQYFTKTFWLRICVALGYAFSATIIIRGAWQTYPAIAMLSMMWLFAFERYYREKKLWTFLLANIVFFSLVEIYECIFYGGVFAVYILFRYVSERKISKKNGCNIIKAWLMLMVGWLMGSLDIVTAKWSNVLNSNRFVNNASDFSLKSLFKPILREKEIGTLIARTLGSSINGITEYFGTDNYLEDPAFYCGLLIVLLIAVSIYNMCRKQALCYVFAYLCVALYIVMQNVRLLCNGFAGITYKMSSHWIILLMILTVLSFGNKIDGGIFRKGSIIVWNVAVFAIILSMFYLYKNGYVLNTIEYIISFIFIIIYAVFFSLFLCRQVHGKYQWLYVIVFIMESIMVNYNAIVNRGVVTQNQLDQGLYNDGTVTALEGINDNEWYRIEKGYNSVFLCDSLAQRYYGTKSYVGGTEIGGSVISLYDTYGLLKNGNHYLYGTGINIYADSSFGVKYYLTRESELPLYGFSYLKTVEGINIYENTNALPLAVVYNSVMSQREYDNLEEYDKYKYLSQVCLVPENNVGIKTDYPNLESEEGKQIEVISEGAGGYKLNKLAESDMLLMQINIGDNGSQQRNQLYIEYEDGRTANYEISWPNRAGQYIYELADSSITYVQIRNNLNDIQDVAFYSVNEEAYYKDFQESIEKLQNNSLEIKQRTENQIEGSISCSYDGIMVVSIPYHENWEIFIDGEKQPVYMVNGGLLGARIDAGTHDVLIKYKTHSWLWENKIKITGMALLLLSGACVAIYNRRKNKNVQNINSSAGIQ